jgi:hypothetical protein
VEAIEVGEIARLVDLVDVCFFGREMDVLADFVSNIAEERIVDEIVDYGVLVAMHSISAFQLKVVEIGAYGCEPAYSLVYVSSTLLSKRPSRKFLCASSSEMALFFFALPFAGASFLRFAIVGF